jgi:hypothetical protein
VATGGVKRRRIFCRNLQRKSPRKEILASAPPNAADERMLRRHGVRSACGARLFVVGQGQLDENPETGVISGSYTVVRDGFGAALLLSQDRLGVEIRP